MAELISYRVNRTFVATDLRKLINAGDQSEP